jgi:hypothetical protein
MYLSKSQYIRGLQCHKALWLYRHRRELMSAPDANREAMFATGHRVGELAKSRFPGGSEIEFDPDDFDGMAEDTAHLVEAGAEVIYEATFVSGGVLVMADILLRNGASWDFCEVKSSTRVKPYHLDDAAVQWHVLNQHIPLGRARVMHINNRYRFARQLDIGQLFTIEDVTDKVRELQPRVAANLATMRAMLEHGEPEVPLGTQCKNPFDCDFRNYCWRQVPVPSVFDLYKLGGERKFELFRRGLVSYRDLREEPLDATQSLQVQTALCGQTHIDRERLALFIESADYPIHFLDFETLQNAIPRFEGQRPYQQIPFQYSLHILHRDGRLEHREYLAGEHCDPRPALAAQLVEDIGPVGSLVAHSQATEIAAINCLANACPPLAGQLRAVRHRFIDLLTPFRGLMYYHPDFNGNFSIKSILPAMFPQDADADYKRLEVQDGRMAMSLYARLAEMDDAAERERIRAALLAYCRLDTLAMVKVWRELARKTG